MLTIYSTKGSPGASTSAMYLAALWASEGREVLLIEADPAGGSISHNLGIQFTPGTASFVASGQTMQSNHLIAHAQDVLFANLHVMPAPASPTGAWGIFQVLSDLSDELRSISENEMAVIIDGGVISPETAASGLTTSAAGVVVVCRGDSPLDDLQHLTDALAASPGGSEAPAGCAVTVGDSSMSAEEWQQSSGLTFSGSIATLPEAASDLTTFLNRTKRKNRKWLASLEQLAEALYPYAQPPLSSRPRRTGTAGADPVPDTQPAAGEHTPAETEPVADEPATDDMAVVAEAPPTAPSEGFPAHEPTAPAAEWVDQPAAAEQAQPSPEPTHGHPPAHYLPPTGWHPYPPPPGQAYEQAGYPPPPGQAYEQAGADGPASPAPTQPQPVAEQPAELRAETTPVQEPPPRPAVEPAGSFRDWAARLHGSKAGGSAAQNTGV